ncbi:MAG: SPOR domain-containing protein [Holophagaceae bacterium]|nr:SPOR domain-containing protein [Holophagaceae bacterium]
MAERESQFITMSRQNIIVATAMGVGLLTFCYVLGVQVGKKSLTRQNVRIKSLDEELNELGQPLEEQLKLFESIEGNNQTRRNDRVPQNAPPRPSVVPTEPPRAVAVPDPETTRLPATPVQAPVDRFTAQVIASRDMGGATRVSEHLKSEGMATKIVSADGLYKVQLDWSGTRAELDSRITRLQILGYQPIAVRVM